jgi:hypothetical protein
LDDVGVPHCRSLNSDFFVATTIFGVRRYCNVHRQEDLL